MLKNRLKHKCVGAKLERAAVVWAIRKLKARLKNGGTEIFESTGSTVVRSTLAFYIHHLLTVFLDQNVTNGSESQNSCNTLLMGLASQWKHKIKYM